MAGLQQLRKRLKSIRATGQLAEAMRTAATIKYSRVSKVREEFTPYAGGSADMLSLLGRFGICREADRISPKNCLVLFGSNRGLCGGFNAELFNSNCFAFRNLILFTTCCYNCVHYGHLLLLITRQLW